MTPHRRRACLRWIPFSVVLACAARSMAQAQVPQNVDEVEQRDVAVGATPAGATPPTRQGALAAVERKPEVYYLMDEHGRLVPVPGFTWEDFEELLSIKEQREGTSRPARYGIQGLRVEGEARGDRAELQLRMDVRLSDSDWVAVPLGLEQAAVRGVTCEGGECRLEPNARQPSVLAWLRAPAEGVLHVTIDLVTPIERMLGSTRMSLSLPRAATRLISLKMAAPGAVANVPVNGGIARSEATADGGTLVTIEGGDGQLQVSWRTPDRPTEKQGALDAIGAQSVQADVRGVTTVARLTVRSAGPPIETLRVRLPPRAVLLPDESLGYSVDVGTSAAADEPAVATVHLREPNTQADITLRTRQEWSPSDHTLELGGFAVLDAVRDRGHLALSVSDEIQPRWEEQFLVRQVDELPAGLRTPSTQAGFEYSAQPFSLAVRMSPRNTKLTVEPRYLVNVSSNRLELDAQFRCRVRGGRIFQLRVDLAGWQLNEEGWGSDTTVSVEQVVNDPTSILVIPFRQSMAGDFDVTLRATQPVFAGTESVSFDLPRPHASLVGPAQLAVLPADNVRLSPHPEAQMGLFRQRPDTSIALPSGRQQPPSFYRGDVEQARYRADFDVRPREVSVQIRTGVEWQPLGVEFQQVLSYRVANAPIDRVRLEVPLELAEPGRLKISLDDTQLAALPVASNPGGAERSTLFDVFLPAERLGEFDVRIRYSLVDGAPVRNALPLVMPRDAAMTGNRLELLPANDATIDVSDQAWKPDESGSARATADRPVPRWNATAAHTRVPIKLATRPAAEGETFVDRAWVQTQLIGELRHERVVWRFTSQGTSLAIRIPDGTLPQDVAVSLDGQRVWPSVESGEMNVFWSPEASRTAAHVLELEYHVEGAHADAHRRLEPVRLVSSGSMGRCYWEVLVPSTRHLIAASAEFTSENPWVWHGYCFAREAQPSMRELETWSGATGHADPPANVNRYMFSTAGVLPPLALRSVERSWLILTVSAVTMALGLTVLQVPFVRRVETAFCVAVAVVALLAVSADLAWLALQCALLGAALVGLAAWLQHRGRIGVRTNVVLQGRTRSSAERVFADRTVASPLVSVSSSARGVTRGASPTVAGDAT